MIILIALLAGVSEQPATLPGAYPTGAVLAAFETTCGDLAEAGIGTAGALSGWDSLEFDHSESEVGRLIAIMRKSAASRPGVGIRESRAFSRMVGGRRLYALLSQLEFEGTGVVQCELFDFNDRLGFSNAEATRWMGRSPTNSAVGATGWWVDWWAPGKTPRQTVVQIEYWPTGGDRSVRLMTSTLPQPNSILETSK